MKKIYLLLFTVLCSGIMFLGYNYSSDSNLYFPKTSKTKKRPLSENLKGRADERAMQLLNFDTKTVNQEDWYNALSQIMSKPKGLTVRGDELKWESMGPEHVGGRTRGFIFDNKVEGRCYTGGVSGGIFVSKDLGFSWEPVKNMALNTPVLSIGCMTQSINGDIYAGTGEYWGNAPNGSGESQFYGGGIYKKKADEEEFKMLSSTFNIASKNNPNGKIFKLVIDITTNPLDSNVVFAATDNGLQISKDGGGSFAPAGAPFNSGIISQIKATVDNNSLVLYGGYNGKVYRSNDGGLTWKDLIGSNAAWTTDGLNSEPTKKHLRIAVSPKNPNKVYVCGVNSVAALKYVIKTTDGGTTWELIGKQDALVELLCNGAGGLGGCQGYYDLCLAVSPKDDDIVFMGGAHSMYTWNLSKGWVLLTNGYSAPQGVGVDGVNLVHSDMHEFVFHPTHPDTLVVCTDGGNYMSYNSYSKGIKCTWRPRNTGYNVTQFYDMNVNKYGEMIGGAQDNGTNLVALRGTNIGGSIEVQGGDGAGCAISASNDYQVIFSSSQNGFTLRSGTLTASGSMAASGSCVDINKDDKFDNAPFVTKLHLAESIIPNLVDPTKDSVEFSYLFVLNNGGIYVAKNAHDTKKSMRWVLNNNIGVGTPLAMHHSPTLSVGYVAGTAGVKKITGMRTAEVRDTIYSAPAGNFPCSYFQPGKGLTYTTLTGISGLINGIYVDQKDDNHVVATAMGFGGTAKVFESVNGTSFVSKQGDLPIMPVYCCAIDPENPKHVVVGTEFGVWETDDISVSSPIWKEQNTEIARVPVFKLRISKLREEGCTVLYAGTHGRGFWRVPFPFKSTCNYTPKARTITSSIAPFSNIEVKFNIYPNPAVNDVNISFHSNTRKTVFIGFYDMAGKLVKRETFSALPGDNISNSDVSSFMKGSYVVRLEDETSVIGGKILQKQ